MISGVQNVWGEESVLEKAPSQKIWTPPKELLVCSVVDLCTGKKKSNDPKGVENVPYEGGPKPLFGRGVIREVFPPLFSTPPLGSTPKGSYSSKGRSRHLLETPFSETLLRTLLRTLFLL